MTPEDYVAVTRRLGCGTATEAAEILGVSVSQSCRYASGEGASRHLWRTCSGSWIGVAGARRPYRCLIGPKTDRVSRLEEDEARDAR